MSEGIFSTGPSPSGTAAAVGTIDVRPYNKMVMLLTMSATTETVSVTGSTDGTNFGTTKIRPIDMGTGAVTASSDFKAGMYLFDVTALHSVKITKSATSETATVRTSLGR